MTICHNLLYNYHHNHLYTILHNLHDMNYHSLGDIYFRNLHCKYHRILLYKYYRNRYICLHIHYDKNLHNNHILLGLAFVQIMIQVLKSSQQDR